MIKELEKLKDLLEANQVNVESEYSREDFNEWLQNPLTKSFINKLNLDYLDKIDALSDAVPFDTEGMVRLAVTTGAKEAIFECLDYLQVKDENES